MLRKPELFTRGFHKTYFTMGDEIREMVRQENWDQLDQTFKELTQENGRLYKFLKEFHDFSSIEFIISLRDSGNDWEEDGIWHDDGSRVFAFSLSLTENSETIKGGRLGVRLKDTDEFFEIPTPEFGGIILFLTGIYGYEHKIHQVTQGRRLIIAGWCS
jgi:hypothetical protein